MLLSAAKVFDLFLLDSNPLHLLSLIRLVLTDQYTHFNFRYTDKKEVEIITFYPTEEDQCHTFTGIVLDKTTPLSFELRKSGEYFVLTECDGIVQLQSRNKVSPEPAPISVPPTGLVLNWDELDALFDLASTPTFPGVGLLPADVLRTNGFICAELIPTTEPVLKLTTSASSGVKVRHLGLQNDRPIHNSTAGLLKMLMAAVNVMFITSCGKDQYLVEGIPYVGLGHYVKNHLSFLLKEYP